MILTIEAASSCPVTLPQAVKHCRAPENGDDDDLVDRALRAAVDYVEYHTTLIMAPTTLEERFCSWPCGFRSYYWIELSRAPVRDVIAVEYLDEAGDLQTISAADWNWVRTTEGARVRFNTDYSFPTLYEEGEHQVRIRYEAGFDDPNASGSGDDPAFSLPPMLPIALLMITENWYEHRGVVTDDEKYPLRMAAEAILSKIMVYR